jgi:GT2 family glycosyltransferase
MTAWRLFKSGNFQEFITRTKRFFVHSNSKSVTDYKKWRETWVDLSDIEKDRILKSVKTLPQYPLFTIFLCADEETCYSIFATVESVCEQLYPNWILYLTNSTPLDLELSEKIESLNDDRVKVVATAPHGIEDWVVELTPKTRLHESALFLSAVFLLENPETQIAYSDHDHIDTSGYFCDPHMKPPWNSDLFAAMNYMKPFVICKKEIWDTRRDKSSDQHRFLLNATKNLSYKQVLRMPYVLASVEISGNDSHLQPSVKRVRYDLPSPEPLVSILIPTRDQGRMLKRCLSSLIEKTNYPNYEIVLVDHETKEKRALKIIETFINDQNIKIKVINYSGSFNFSAMMNRAASVSEGQVLLLLNNDTEIIESEWLTELVSQVSRPEVGIAGALLLFGDGTIQHAGVHPGVNGLMGHGHKHLNGDNTGYFNRLKAVHEVSAVTGACLAIEKSVWKGLGGLDEQNLTVAYNDIDLCLKARLNGLRIIFTPFAKLVHHESVSRGVDDDPATNKRLGGEISVMFERWGDMLDFDPAYSPNLTLEGKSFALSKKPRISTLLDKKNY